MVILVGGIVFVQGQEGSQILCPLNITAVEIESVH